MNNRMPSVFSKVEVYTRLSDIIEVWAEIESVAPATGYQTRIFLNAWMQTFGKAYSVSPFIVVAFDTKDHPVALLPLVTKKSGFMTIASFMGAPEAGYQCGLFRNPDDFTKEVVIAILRQAAKLSSPAVDMYSLEKLVPDIGNKKNPFARLPAMKNTINSWGIDLNPDINTYLQAQFTPSRIRDTFGKRKRRLEKIGTVRYPVLSSGDKTDAVIDELILQKRERFKATQQVSLYDEEVMREFCLAASTSDYSSHSTSAKWHFMTVGDTIVSIYMGIIHQGIFYNFLKSVITHAEFDRCSPGHIMQVQMFTDLSLNGIFKVEEGTGGDNHKKIFSNRSAKLFNVTYPVTLKGQVLCSILNFMDRAKFMIKNTPWAYALAQKIKSRIVKQTAASEG